MRSQEIPEHNVHKQLRIVWLFVKYAEVKEARVKEEDLPPMETKNRGNPGPMITKDEAIKALDSLYQTFMEPFAGPCEGAKLRTERIG